MNSPRDGSDLEDEMREDDEDLSRAGISTRGKRRGANSPDNEETFNEDLNMTQVPQVSILDTDGKNMKLDEDTDEALDVSGDVL